MITVIMWLNKKVYFRVKREFQEASPLITACLFKHWYVGT